MEQPVYASVWNRFIAFMIDGFVLNIVFALIIIVPTQLGMAPEGLMAAVMGMYWIAVVLYYTLMHASPYQATIGKMVLGMKVVGADGGRLSYLRSLARYLVMIIEFMFFLPLFVIFFSSKNRMLHDMAVGSTVTDLEAERPGKYRTARKLAPLLLLITILFPGLVGTYYVNNIIDEFMQSAQADMEMIQMESPSAAFGMPPSGMPSQGAVTVEGNGVMPSGTKEENGVQHFSFQSHWEISTSQSAKAHEAPSVAEGPDATEQLFELAKGSKDDDYAVMRLVVRGADVNARDDKGRTPLFYAVQQHHVEMVKALVFKGSNTRVKDHEGTSIQMLARHDRALRRALRYADGH
jgi:uncharacterized RDD family membrane protein YckC